MALPIRAYGRYSATTIWRRSAFRLDLPVCIVLGFWRAEISPLHITTTTPGIVRLWVYAVSSVELFLPLSSGNPYETHTMGAAAIADNVLCLIARFVSVVHFLLAVYRARYSRCCSVSADVCHSFGYLSNFRVILILTMCSHPNSAHCAMLLGKTRSFSVSSGSSEHSCWHGAPHAISFLHFFS